MPDQPVYLYVEDDPYSRQVIELLIRNAMGVDTIYIFDSTEDFMDRLASLEKRPDIILLDIHIKPLDGFQVLKLLRASKTYERTRIIAVTASVMNEEFDRLKQSGFDGAIAKPVSMKTFPQLMERIVRGEAVWHIT